MELYLQSSLGFQITDGDGNPVSVEQAKAQVKSGQVEAMNIAMQRLIDMGFDMDALKAHYEQQDTVL